MNANLINKYYLYVETHRRVENDTDLLNLVSEQSLWNIFVTDNKELITSAALKSHFGALSTPDKERLFRFGIACLLRFVQANFTGPLGEDSKPAFNEICSKATKLDYAACLTVNGEEINVNTCLPSFLVVSKLVFECCHIQDIVNSWWNLRAIMIHQDILDEPSPILLSEAERVIKSIETCKLSGRIKGELELELAQVYLKFRHVSKAKICIENASQLLGVDYELVGVLGKRTRFQENDLPQLSVKITLEERDFERPSVEDFAVPNNLPLNDEVRLDRVHLCEQQNNPELGNTEQKVLLSRIRYNLMAVPSDELEIEQILPVLEAVLEQKNTFCVRVASLLLRCTMECSNKRTIERCLRQCDSIVASWKHDEPPLANRVFDVFSTALQPNFRVLNEYGYVLLTFGLVKNCLDIFLRTKEWDKVIICYNLLKLRHKAAEIIKEQLAIKPSPKLYCYLGDATDDQNCYETAWQLSKFRSHRAQKHWALFLYHRKQYLESMPHFEKSLSINPLQTQLWFCLGFAAQETENWQKAATAYRRYTTLAPDSFEAWNNLAQAYLKLGNNRNAHQALLEALKCNFDNWKIWENLLLVSCDLSNYSDVIRSYHRLIDLKGKYLNEYVLTALMCGVRENSSSESGKHLQKTRELLARVAIIYPNSGPVWELYALLAPSLTVALQRLQKSYRGYTQSGWEKSPQSCADVLGVCDKMADVVLDGEVDVKIDVKEATAASVRLMMASALATVKKQDWEETRNSVKELEGRLEKLVEKMTLATGTKA